MKKNYRFLMSCRRLMRWISTAFIDKSELGLCGNGVVFERPCFLENPKGVFLHDYARLRHYCSVINAPDEKVIIKKYSVIAAGVTFITNSHRNTVGLPQIILGGTHINDKKGDIIVEEDVWIGAEAMIMPGVRIGRGSVVGARSIVTHDVPPYAVVVGAPTRIIAKAFELNDVLEHEKRIYPREERFSIEVLQDIFLNYEGLKIFGCKTDFNPEQIELINEIKNVIGYPDDK